MTTSMKPSPSPKLERGRGKPKETARDAHVTYEERRRGAEREYQAAFEHQRDLTGKRNRSRVAEQELKAELMQLPERGHARLDALKDQAKEEFLKAATTDSWFVHLASPLKGNEVAKVPPTSLVTAYLLAYDPKFLEALHGVIEHQVADPNLPGFSKRSREEIETDLVKVAERQKEIAADLAKAEERTKTAAAQVREFDMGRAA